MRELQERLDEEAEARIGAQEHVIALAQQLIDKDRALRELRTDLVMSKGTPGKLGGGKRAEKARCQVLKLEAENLALLNKLRELERKTSALEGTINERDVLAKTHARNANDFLFRIEVLEEEKARLAERLAAADPSYSPPSPTPTTNSREGVPGERRGVEVSGGADARLREESKINVGGGRGRGGGLP